VYKIVEEEGQMAVDPFCENFKVMDKIEYEKQILWIDIDTAN